MPDPQQQQQGGYSQQFSTLVGIAQCGARVWQAILARETGDRLFGPQCAIGMVGYYVLIAEWDPRYAVIFELIVAAALLMRRVVEHEPRKTRHSRHLRSWSPKAEVIGLLVASLPAMAISPGLGLACLIGSFSIAVDHDYYHLSLKAQSRAIRDAQIEAEERRSYYESRYR